VSPFLVGITWLLLFQCAGESVTQLFGLPIPGPVVGMLALFVTLRSMGRVFESLSVSADGLARHLSLLFVPAGVGVMLHFARLAAEWLPIIVALVGSTVLTIAAAALTFSALMKRRQHGDEELPSAEP